MYDKKIVGQLLQYLMIFLFIVYGPVIKAKSAEYEFVIADESYPYSVIQAGENFNFKFNKNPKDELIKLEAGYHVLQSVYQDASISRIDSKAYIRERARCYMVDSNFYSYTLCFLPNEFSQKKTDRLWGFVTKMPNWKWLLTRFLLPVIVIYAFFFYITRRSNS
jgi:hypothetical protein